VGKIIVALHSNKYTKALILLTIVFTSWLANAGLEYCEGTVSEIVTRNSSEATYIKLSTKQGATGWAKIGDGNGYNEYQQMQISMLLAAYMSKVNVQLELQTDGYEFNSCQNFQTGLPVRFVRFR